MSEVTVIGVPSSAGCRQETSYAIDQDRAPGAIRAALQDMMSGFNIPLAYGDAGDVSVGGDVPEMLQAVQAKVSEVAQRGDVPFLLGGAHTLTLGTLRAISKIHPEFSLIYFDAHPDLMPHPQINYGSSLYYAVKEGVISPERLALIGIRQIEQEETAFIEREGIYSVHPFEFESAGGTRAVLEQITRRFKPPYFISIDLDGIDPSFAPGVTSPFPGGLTVREVLYLASELCRYPVAALEVVELAPVNDRNEETARIAAIFLHTLSTIASEQLGRK